MRALQAHVCGVEVLLGYCCDKPGELRSHSASPAPAERRHGLARSAWRRKCLPGILHGFVCPWPLPSGDPCLRAAPEQLNAAGERFKRQRVQLASAVFFQHLQPNSILEFDSRGELEGIFFLTLLPIPSHYLLCFKAAQRTKNAPNQLGTVT